MWREWGRSIDLRDSTRPGRRILDSVLLVLTMGLPLPLLAAITLRAITTSPNVTDALFAINGVLLLIRVLLLGALANSYERPGLTFWLSPLADPLAVARVLVSTFRRPRAWRGRKYPG
jgi:dolichol-phosphate mannosyltransferase